VLARTPAYRVARRRHLAEYTGLTLPREFRSMDVAATSSRCDMLADALNTQAKVHGEAVHLRLDYLLSTLSRTNRGQGVVSHSVRSLVPVLLYS
jgi:hypothetical protein